MDPNSFGALAGASKWYALVAFGVALLIRLLKDDTKLPTIPARLRPWLSVFAGFIALVVDKLAMGSSWRDATFNAAIVGLLPIVVHELGVEAIAGGKDVPLPNVVLTAEAKAAKGPPSPPVLPILMLGLLLSLSSGCAALKGPNTVIAADLSEKIACAIANALSTDSVVKAICKIADNEMPFIERSLAMHREKMAALREKASAGPCIDYRTAPIAPVPSASACPTCGKASP